MGEVELTLDQCRPRLSVDYCAKEDSDVNRIFCLELTWPKAQEDSEPDFFYANTLASEFESNLVLSKKQLKDGSISCSSRLTASTRAESTDSLT